MINITRHKQKQQFFDIVADKGSIGVGKNLNGTFIRNEYLYGLEEHPNAPQQVGERRYTYSASGNPLTIEGGDVSRTLTWDAENRLRRIYDSRSGQLHLYTYNHLGERALKRYGKAQAMAVNDKDAGALLDTKDNYSAYVSPYFVGHNGRYTKHYYAGAMRIASKMGASGSTYAAGTDEPDLYFYHTDHLGSTTYITDRKEVAQYVAYTPYGETFKEYRNVTPYKFNGKELDQETGYYYYGARYYDPSIALWFGTDPLAHKYPMNSPYIYCNGNPVKYVDPDGRAPIYGPDGNLIGTDDKGLQGEAIVLNSDNFKQGMSHDEALKYNLGEKGFNSEESEKKYLESYKSLSSRPDWDGIVTDEEARKWWANGTGETLYVDAAKIDLSPLSKSDFKKENDDKLRYNFFLSPKSSRTTARVYGTITMKLKDRSSGEVGFYTDKNGFFDTYDFNSDGRIARDITTWVAKQIVGEGTPYGFKLYGSNPTLKK